MLANGKMGVCYTVQMAVDGKRKLIAAFEVTNDGNDKNHLMPVATEAGMDIHVAGRDYNICVPTEEGKRSSWSIKRGGVSIMGNGISYYARWDRC
jgi:hypothetical protein